MTIATAELAVVNLADGTSVEVPSTLLDQFRGITISDEGYMYLVVAADAPMKHEDGSEWLYSLTDCCNASGKGGEFGLVCRSCYNECEDIHASYIAPHQLIARV